jgi:hypothetical protein
LGESEQAVVQLELDELLQFESLPWGVEVAFGQELLCENPPKGRIVKGIGESIRPPSVRDLSARRNCVLEPGPNRA